MSAPDPGFPVQLGDGEPARAVGFANGVLELVCRNAYPPGKPLSLALESEHERLELTGKSAGSKRRPDDRFAVRLKLLSLRRPQRELLERLFS